jgi:O-acetyl-ADP-ribose deacetylase (regulator of RNase III)
VGRSGSSEPSASRYSFGARTLEVVYGDLALVPADALVSSDDNYLTMGGGVSAALLGRAGPAMREHARKFLTPQGPSPLRRGDVVVTTAGLLPAKFVFHAVTIDHDSGQHPTPETIRTATGRAMMLADALQLRCIAYPALGTGVGGFPFNVAADAMVRTIGDCLDRAEYVQQVIIALRAREGVKETDLNTFYTASVGLIAQWEQAKRLRAALHDLEAEAIDRDMNESADRVSTLSDELESVLGRLAVMPPTVADLRDESRTRAVADVAARAMVVSQEVSSDFNENTAQAAATEIEALRLSLAAARHRMGGLQSQRAYGQETAQSRDELAATICEVRELHARIEAIEMTQAPDFVQPPPKGAGDGL